MYLDQHETIYVSIEGEVYKINTQSTVKLPTNNNHDEADTRMIWLCTLFQEQDVIIQSTGTNILWISMVVHNKLNLKSRNVVIHYGKSSADFIYCHLNKLVQLVEQDPQLSLLRTRKFPIPRILGALHFTSGCDDLSYLRGFTKNNCLNVFYKHSDLICGDSNDEIESLFTGNIASVKRHLTLHCHLQIRSLLHCLSRSQPKNFVSSWS